MFKTFGALVVDGQPLAESAPVWLDRTRYDGTDDDWHGTILLDQKPPVTAGSHALLRLEDGREAEVVLGQFHPGADGGLLLRFSSSGEE